MEKRLSLAKDQIVYAYFLKIDGWCIQAVLAATTLAMPHKNTK